MFVDAGAVSPSGSRLRDRHLDRGYGGGAYAQLTVLSVSLDIARAQTGGTRAHFGLGVSFK